MGRWIVLGLLACGPKAPPASGTAPAELAEGSRPSAPFDDVRVDAWTEGLRVRAAIDAARTDAELAALYHAVVDTLPAWTDSAADLDYDHWRAHGGEITDPAWGPPGLRWVPVAGGQVFLAGLDAKTWQAAAAKSDGTQDDRFFALMPSMFVHLATPTGSPAWLVATSDAGGCSGLGSGMMLEVFDLLAEPIPLFQRELDEVRRIAVDHVVTGNPHYPHCDPNTGEAAHVSDLAWEVREILRRGQLDPRETEQLTVAFERFQPAE